MSNVHNKQNKDKTISKLFEKLSGQRSNWQHSWEMCAEYTLPYIYQTDEKRKAGLEPEDLLLGDSIGATSLSSLVSQVGKVAFPENGAFFRYAVKKGDNELSALPNTQQQNVLRNLEESAMTGLYKLGLNAAGNLLLKHLLGLGTTVFRVPVSEKKSESIEVFDLNNVVIKRRKNGQITDVIIREKEEYRFLDDNAKKALLTSKRDYKDSDTVDYYTHLKRRSDGKLEIVNAVDDFDIPSSKNFCTDVDCEYKVASLNLTKGSDYGAGVVLMYLPLIHKANVYADTNTDTAVAGSMVNWAVAPTAQITPEEFASREQGQPFGVKPDDIQAIVANVGQQLAITSEQYNMIRAELARTFLLPQAIQRDAERVTAEEIRMIAQRLEEVHSGLYSEIAELLQRPLAELGIQLIDDEELLPYVDSIEVEVVTALEKKSRNRELDNVMAALGDTTIFNSLNPEIVSRLKTDTILSTIFNNRNNDANAMVKSEEELQAEQQAAAEAEANAQAQAQGGLGGAGGAPQPTLALQPNQNLLGRVNKPLI